MFQHISSCFRNSKMSFFSRYCTIVIGYISCQRLPKKNFSRRRYWALDAVADISNCLRVDTFTAVFSIYNKWSCTTLLANFKKLLNTGIFSAKNCVNICPLVTHDMFGPVWVFFQFSGTKSSMTSWMFWNLEFVLQQKNQNEHLFWFQ